MAKVLKWVAVVLVALVLLVVGAAFALQQWLRTDDFRGRVERQAGEALGVPLKLGRLSIDLWPLPAVAADDVQVQTRPAPLTIERVEARPVYAALLSGRLEIATLTVRKAVLPQTGIAALGAAMQRHQKPSAKAAAAPARAQGRGSLDLLPHRAEFDAITWIDEKGMRMTADVQAELGSDGLLDQASFKIVQGRLAGTQGRIERDGTQWPLHVDIGGGHITGKLQLQAAKAGSQLLTGQLATENVEVAALTAPSRPLTGKLQAQTTLRAEYREPGQIADVLTTQTHFTVRNAVVQGIDLQKAVQTVGLSRGGMTRLDTLAGQVNTQGKAVHLSNLVATSGALSATGNVSISPAKALSGRVNVDVARSKGTLGVPLEVSGTVDEPSVMLTRGAMVGAAIGTLVMPGAGTAAGAGAGDRIGESLRGLFGK
jgi:uncharacterized protein involved in outer membrane biogenesis